jgi:hypothetical protein
MNNLSPDQMRIVQVFMDTSKTPEETCTEIKFEDCEQMKKEYLAELNVSTGCSSCRKSSIRRKYTSFIKPRIISSD